MATVIPSSIEATANQLSDNKEIKTENSDEINEFVRIGRTGRRNAVADVILDPNMHISTSSLAGLIKKIDFGSNNNTQMDCDK